jgi:hypothetical protein
MSSQVFGEGALELKSSSGRDVLLSGREKGSPNGVPGFPFYRPREGPEVHEREKGGLEAAPYFLSYRWTLRVL